MVEFSASILNCDFTRLGEEIKAAEEAGVNAFHLDVMDGHFVPNISFGPPVTKHIRTLTRLPLRAHLMISDPVKYAPDFAETGADEILYHIEVADEETLPKLLELGKPIGVTLNPDTDLRSIYPILPQLSQVLLMSVFPGFGGQKFIPKTLFRISNLRREIEMQKLSVPISVDGGVNPDTAEGVREAGADILIVGSALFSSDDYAGVVRAVKGE
ncbi:ribulose-phosphate 3-epimerase [candidate division WOR-3 bacterium]|uniref:Ribulose-phosphate 3-epimerase n=1 Tax=candidate division WOR-3 bacterium TaxID=2052148 RepID=A0A9D5QDB5_UNCW3|nr:ribulose-phosphate 3-epimerase [candidate division WOR-3 bacterium]MBD3365444.1 ribulose-phosphate 3-epimerase [candidate division WOR-3 bacterium]